MKSILISVAFVFACGSAYGQFCFDPAVNYSTPSDAFGVCKGDFNGDGHMDVASTNRTNNMVSIFFGDGTGVLTLMQNVNCPGGPEGIISADFTGDGILDLATANNSAGIVSVLFNDGLGFFTLGSQTSVDQGPKRLVAYDFNADGFKDVAVGCFTQNTMMVLLGNGAGTFTTTNVYGMSSPMGICSGDFNNDGFFDLATTNNAAGQVSVRLGVGDGTFLANTNYGLGGNGPYGITSEDVNADGNIDLMVANSTSNNIGKALGAGTGTFGFNSSLPANAQPRAIAIGDFNQDGNKDMAAALYGSGEVGVYAGDGLGGFMAGTNFSAGGGTRDVVVCDLNEDGRDDIVTANINSSSLSVLLNSIPTINVTGTNPVCLGSSTTLVAAGAESYTWNTGSINDSLIISPSSNITYTITGNNSGCGLTGTAVITVTVNPLPVISATANPASVCTGTPLTLTGGGALTYTWSHGVTNGVSFPAQSGSTNYTVTGTDNNGCVNSNTITVSPSTPTAPDICTVTVDSLSLNNVIVWDKTLYPNADSFMVYRDTANNNYALIGTLPYGALSQFTDTARSIGAVNGDPNITTYRYKLAYRDTCGNMSPQSPYHNTIYNYNSGSLFLWNHYEIQGQTTPVSGLSNYVLKRDNLGGTGNYVTAATAGASSTNINDPQYATWQTTADWRVETIWSITCTPSMRLGENNATQGTIVKSKSNITNNKTTSITKILDRLVSVYPNPAHDNFFVHFNSNVIGTFQLKIYSVMGNEVYSGLLVNPSGDIMIDLNKYDNGVYLLQLVSDAGIITKRIIKN